RRPRARRSGPRRAAGHAAPVLHRALPARPSRVARAAERGARARRTSPARARRRARRGAVRRARPRRRTRCRSRRGGSGGMTIGTLLSIAAAGLLTGVLAAWRAPRLWLIATLAGTASGLAAALVGLGSDGAWLWRSRLA